MEGSLVDNDIDIHSGRELDGGDLFDLLVLTVQVDVPFVDPHLELVPGLSSLSAGESFCK